MRLHHVHSQPKVLRSVPPRDRASDRALFLIVRSRKQRAAMLWITSASSEVRTACRASVNQILLSDSSELSQPRLPCCCNLGRCSAFLQCCKRCSIGQQSNVVLNLPRPWVQTVELIGDFDTGRNRMEGSAIRDDDVDSTALFVGKHGRFRRESYR